MCWGVWRVFQGFSTVTARPSPTCIVTVSPGCTADRSIVLRFHGLVVPSGELERDRVPPLIDVFIDVLNLFGDLWSGIDGRKQDLWSSLQTAPVRLGRSWHWALACSGSVGIGSGVASRGPLRTPGERDLRHRENRPISALSDREAPVERRKLTTYRDPTDHLS